MRSSAFQDNYSDETAICYGCGRLNEKGLKIKSYWDEEGKRTVCRFRPRPEHTGGANFLYGGLVASLIDCHATGSAAAFAEHAGKTEQKGEAYPRFVTASLTVDYLKPTPIDCELELYGYLEELKSRKAVIRVELEAFGEICAKGRVVAVRLTAPLKVPSADGR